MMKGISIPEERMEMVPEAEIRSRYGKIQAYLASKDLDGAFFLQNVDLYYLSGTLQRAILYVPGQGEPLLMVIKSYARARKESALREVLPLSGRDAVWGLLEDYGYGHPKRVGLELDVLPAAQYLWFKKNLPASEVTDISPAIRTIRMIKSAYESNQIRRATAILDIGFREVQGYIREGMTELAVDGFLAQIARREGHMGFLRMRGWNQEMSYAHVLSGESGAVVSFCDTPVGGPGNTPAVAQGAGFRRIRKNEPVLIDYGVGFNGYLSDQTRTLVIGKLPDNLAAAHACSREILARLETQIRPGMPCARVYDTAEAVARERGVEAHFMGYGEGKVKFLGHGFGLEIDEYPIFSPNSPQVIEEGMVFALEPKFVFPEQGVVGIEDDYLVTASGMERLTLTAQELILIPG